MDEKKKIVPPEMRAETLDVSMKCVQYMLFVSNFLFVMIGLLLISIGTVIKTMYIDFEYFLDPSYFSPSDLLIFSGFIIFFVAFFGCWGAIKESTSLINIYTGCLSFILALEVLVVIFTISMRFSLQTTIADNMETVFERAKYDKKLMDIFDFTQSQLHCCGINNMTDWSSFDEFKGTKKLPQSCCPNYDNNHGMIMFACEMQPLNFAEQLNKPYPQPCKGEVVHLISETAYLLGSGAFCVAFIQVIGIIFSRLLSKSIRDIKIQRKIDAEKRRQQIYSQIVLSTQLNEKNSHQMTASEA